MATVGRTKAGRWKVRWKEPRPGGGWADRSKSFDRERDARAYKAAVEVARSEGRTILARNVCEDAGLGEMIARYLEHSARVSKRNTLIGRGVHLELFDRYLRTLTRLAVLPAGMLTHQNLSGFWVWLAIPSTSRNERGRQDGTRRAYVATVEDFWKWAFRRQQRGEWSGVPYPDSLELRKPATPAVVAPTWEQMDAAIAHATPEWRRRLFVLLRCTGLRVEQALALEWSDFSPDLTELHIRGDLGKSRQEQTGRWLPVAPVLRAEIATWGMRDGRLVTAPVGYKRRSRAAWMRAEVPEPVWSRRPHHAFRKGFATGLRQAGVPGDAIDYLVGHSARSTRGIYYTDARALGLVEAVALVPPIGTSNVVALPAAEQG